MTCNPERVRCLFGTDGVRDVANRGDMTPEMALRLGRSYILFLAERGIPRPRIAVGRDTRRSGLMLEAALAAGMTSAGADVYLLGVIPTPGVSFAVKKVGMQGGAVISASHNPAEYNGIKFMDGAGCKLSDDTEAVIEEYMGDNLTDDWRPTGASIGVLRQYPEIGAEYVDWLASLWRDELAFPSEGAMDCAHGAAYCAAPSLFSRLGGDWTVVGNAPDGLNINEGVGVMKMSHLCSLVKEKKLSIGIAYDGDADRVLFCDSRGRTLNGDIMLWVLARWLHSEGRLGNGVVATVMSNMALEEHLSKTGIPVHRCQVGDRYVLETMNGEGAMLGGEQSGHVIMSSVANTGDGICTGLCFIEACQALGEDMDTLADRFSPYPQVLKNISIPRDSKADSSFIDELTAEMEPIMGGEGRILIRPSGTEPLMRILVEARDKKLMEEVAQLLVNSIREKYS
ncbi:MAG: phosphoglucosamine mutase [Synergistaceae bacterium]|nr:phosphoglucosamine mutase [Synergistaceae bacterium]